MMCSVKQHYWNCVNRRLILLILLIGASAGVGSPGYAEEHPYRVLFGSLEINAEKARQYVFKWGKQEEVFDVSLEAFMKASGSESPGLPSLLEVGFRVVSGKIYKYGNLAPDVYMKKFVVEHPGEVADALVFQGYLEESLILKLDGPTRVCRVDVVSSGKKLVLWKNMPDEPSKVSR